MPRLHRPTRRFSRFPRFPLLLVLALSACGEPDPPDDGPADDRVATAEADDAADVDADAPDADRTDDEPTSTAEADALGIALAPEASSPDAVVPTPPSAPESPPAPTPPSSPATDSPSAAEPSATASADCASTLPCRLVTADGGLAATLTAADGAVLDGSGPLRIDVVVEALSRDARVGIAASSSVVAGGQVLEVDALRLGVAGAPGARDEAAFDLLAGVPINGHVTFGGDLVGNPGTLDRVTLALTEAGTARRATFADVPLGPEPGAPIDCAASLPCLWTSADGTATIALTDAVPERWNRAERLVVSWSFTATRPLEIALSGLGRVTGGDGEALEPYGIELGGVESSDGTLPTRALAAGESVTGRVVPRRVPASDAALGRVEIDVVERRSPRAPRWRPVFVDVPLRPADP